MVTSSKRDPAPLRSRAQDSRFHSTGTETITRDDRPRARHLVDRHRVAGCVGAIWDCHGILLLPALDRIHTRAQRRERGPASGLSHPKNGAFILGPIRFLGSAVVVFRVDELIRPQLALYLCPSDFRSSIQYPGIR